MRISVHRNGLELTDTLRTHVSQQLYLAIGWAARHLRNIRVSLTDMNGPRGGMDKRCRIEAQLHSGKQLVIEDVETDVYSAIEIAALKADKVIARCIQRKRLLLRNFAGSSKGRAPQ